MDAPIVLLETFWSIQVDSAFGLCEALSEVVNEALLACHCDLQLADVVVGLLLLVTEIIDEAIDDLSWCGCVVGMGGQGHEGGSGRNTGRGLSPSGWFSCLFSCHFSAFLLFKHFDLGIVHSDRDDAEAGLFGVGGGSRHEDADAI